MSSSFPFKQVSQANPTDARQHLRDAPDALRIADAVAMCKERLLGWNRPCGWMAGCRWIRCLIAIGIGVPVCISEPVWGQDSPGIAKPSPLPISSLPTPPAEFKTLIQQGVVTFETGDRDQSLESVDGPRVSAETRYRVSYHFHSNSKWDVRAGKLTVRIQFRDIRWGVTHVVWFRRLPEPDSFWANPLVKHEFDHVRISSDPRFKDVFGKRLRASSVLVREISPGQRVNDAMVDKIVEQAAEDVFESLSELVAIRYAELDRVTRHGRMPLPSDHGLFDPVSP